MTNFAAQIRRSIQHCVWDLTTACNLRCLHCELDAGRRDPAELSPAEALVVAHDLVDAGCRRVSLTGGEPLLRKDWPELCRYLAEAGVWVSIMTNGLLLDSETLDRVVAAGAQAVSVSLDGPRDVHDRIRVSPNGAPSRFDSALRALQRVAASPLRTAAITHINRWNLPHLDELYELINAVGVELWQVQLAFPFGRVLKLREPYLIDPSDLPDLIAKLARFQQEGRVRIAVADSIGYYGRHEPLLRINRDGRRSYWMGCMAGCLGVAIASNGDVKGCPSHPQEFVVGNVRDEPFGQIWADASRFAYNTEWKDELLEGGCAQCQYRRICRAGCTAMAYALTGTIYDNPFCLQRVNS